MAIDYKDFLNKINPIANFKRGVSDFRAGIKPTVRQVNSLIDRRRGASDRGLVQGGNVVDKTVNRISQIRRPQPAPTPNLRARDIFREFQDVSSPLGQVKWLGRNFVRPAAQYTTAGLTSLQGRKEFVPKTPTEKLVLGRAPVKSVQQGTISQGLQKQGVSPGLSNLAGTSTLVGGLALELTGVGGIEKRLAKEVTEQGVKKILGKSAKNFSDDIIKNIAKTRDSKAIKGLLSGGGEGLSSAQIASRNIQEQITKQKSLKKGTGLVKKSKDFLRNIKTKFVDFTVPISETLANAEKQSQFKVAPTKDIRYQIDRVLRSEGIAGQFIKDNGFDKIIKNVDNLDEFNQYLISRHAADVERTGIKTGRDLAKDSQVLNAFSGKYEGAAKQVTAYTRTLLDHATNNGLISAELNRALKKKYPNYVPLNRIMEEIEGGVGVGNKAVASLGKQTVVQSLKGSERAIEAPIDSILARTSSAIHQVEKNRAAQMITSYKDIPGNPFGLRKLAPGEGVGLKSTISVLENGKKSIYETTPEIAEAAKNLSSENLGLLGKIISIPTRILKLGATGVNIPFVAANVAKDQVFAAVNSSNAAKTSLANPTNFSRSFWSALTGGGELYDDWVRSGSAFTIYDISRNSKKSSAEKIRAGRSLGSKVAYTIKNPGDILRGIEDIVGKSEELTRLQQFGGTRGALLKSGRTAADAEVLAAGASRTNTANFGRSGSYSKVLNSFLPYVNAGIQGSRTLVNSIKTRPLQTGAKLAAFIFTPTAMATTWNLSDPARRAAYEDIPEYEKENNIIIMPPNPEKDENGRWNAMKVPLTPGLSNLGSIVRRQVETMQGFDTQSFMKVATDFLEAGTSFDLGSKEKIASQFTPQGLKTGIELNTNTNLFTGNPIVPDNLLDLPPERQVYDNTSGTARKIGGALGISPLQVQNAVGTNLAGVGRQLLNLSDKTLAATGQIPESQIGGRGIVEDIGRRFTSAKGGQKVQDIFNPPKGKGKTLSVSTEIIEHRGNFFVDGIKDSFDTREEAEFALTRENFRKTGKKSEVIGDTHFYTSSDGKKVYTETKLEYGIGLDEAQKSNLKEKGDFKGWAKNATELMGKYKEEWQTDLTEEQRVKLETDILKLYAEMQEFGGYGGFKKPKSGSSKKGYRAPISLLKPASVKRPSPGIGSIKTSPNVNFAKLTLRGGSRAKRGVRALK